MRPSPSSHFSMMSVAAARTRSLAPPIFVIADSARARISRATCPFDWPNVLTSDRSQGLRKRHSSTESGLRIGSAS